MLFGSGFLLFRDYSVIWESAKCICYLPLMFRPLDIVSRNSMKILNVAWERPCSSGSNSSGEKQRSKIKTNWNVRRGLRCCSTGLIEYSFGRRTTNSEWFTLRLVLFIQIRIMQLSLKITTKYNLICAFLLTFRFRLVFVLVLIFIPTNRKYSRTWKHWLFQLFQAPICMVKFQQDRL